jgi:hypothetical protein
MFQIRCDRSIPKRIKKRLVHAAHWLEERYKFRTHIKLVLRNQCCIKHPECGRCWGVYSRITKTIQLACGCKAPHLYEHLDTLIHEFVHYDQARRGIAMHHRGMKKRVKRMLQEYCTTYHLVLKDIL